MDGVTLISVPHPLKNCWEITDEQIGGNHYRDTEIQPWDVIRDWKLNYWEGNVIKYVKRWRKKHRTKQGQLEDLKKARHYLDYLIKLAEEGNV